MDRRPPSAQEHFERIIERLRDRRPAVFLDYDGTLTPIVARPQFAVLNGASRAVVARLARACPVAIVSGRDVANVRERVGISGIYYAGSHGFDIIGPAGEQHQHELAIQALPALDAAERDLRVLLGGIAGSLVERKRFTVAVHYRLVREPDVAAVAQAVDGVIARCPGLRKGLGKKVLEVLPDIDWNKGAAVRWLLRTLGLDVPAVVPLYIGDDVTDEDAFLALADRGIGIAVMERPAPTAAAFRLPNPAAVRTFLEALTAFLEHRS